MGVSQSPFLRGDSINSNTIDGIIVPYVGLGASVSLYQSSIFNLKVSGAADLLAPANAQSYTVQTGYSFTGKLSLEQQGPGTHSRLGADFYYRYTNQNTSLTTQNSMEIGAILRFQFDYFEGKKGAEATR
jgi:hypothetical protein